MALWYQPTEEQRAAWDAWVLERPPEIAELARRFVPWRLYRMSMEESRDQRVVVRSFQEAGAHNTCECVVTGKPHCETTHGPTLTVMLMSVFNLIGFERSVFGIEPDRLEECDLPPLDELVGSAELKPEEIRLPPGERLAIGLNRMHLGNAMPFRLAYPAFARGAGLAMVEGWDA